MPPPTPKSLAALQAQLNDIFQRHSEFYDSLTAEFGKQLDRIVAWTLAALMEKLRTSLTLSDGGVIARNPANLVALTKLDTEFQALIRKHGYRRAIRAFVNQFPEQFDLLRETFEVLSYALDRKDLRQGKLLYASDLKVLHAQQTSAIDVLNDVPVQVGIRAKQKAVQLLGAGDLAEMQHMLHTAFDRGTSDTVNLGATAMSTFYRVAEGRVYDRIQGDTNKPLLYVYSGPDDVLTRKFCHRMLAEVRRGKTWTMAELRRLDNGQTGTGTVPEMCGGFRCRHQLVLALDQNERLN